MSIGCDDPEFGGDLDVAKDDAMIPAKSPSTDFLKIQDGKVLHASSSPAAGCFEGRFHLKDCLDEVDKLRSALDEASLMLSESDTTLVESDDDQSDSSSGSQDQVLDEARTLRRFLRHGQAVPPRMTKRCRGSTASTSSACSRT